MLAKLFHVMAGSLSPVRRFFWRRCYQYLAEHYGDCGWKFMNYGYQGMGQPMLLPEDEPDRYCIQLYHHLIQSLDLEGRSVLEVSCGRGGGCSYIRRYARPRRVVGLDFASNAVRMCRKCHRMAGLTFQVGDAERLPFEDRTFDAVLNVEASHCYGSVDVFVSHVSRVLRPGGHFLMADFRNPEEMGLLRQTFAASSLSLAQEKDITANVVQAMTLDSSRKKSMVDRAVPYWLRKSISEFAGLEGSRILKRFRSRERVYSSFVLRKGD